MTKQIEHIKDLTPDPQNARAHTARNIDMITTSLQQVGAARSIVIDETGVVLAGNGVLEAAADAGIERVRVVDADGEEIIAVRRSNLTEEQKLKLALYDNRAAELAEWNVGQLLEFSEAGVDLSGMFSDFEIGQLAEAAGIMPRDGSDFDPNAEWQGMPEFEHPDINSAFQVVVHFANEADLQDFEALVGQRIPRKSRVASSIWFPQAEQLSSDGFGYDADES